jgi:NADPH:quinone reductase-like Zn-dependent oxidoreductase
MKAIVNTVYGSPDVLRFTDVDKPLPKDNEVLIKIHAASVNAADWHLLRADPFLVRFSGLGMLKPKNTILGSDVAGIVEAVGAKVRDFKPADQVFGDVFVSGFGAFAEYVCSPEEFVVLKPPTVGFDEAAAVPLAALTALHGLRDNGKIKAGQKVLINGASGGVGSFAVQLAKYFDTEVTAVCSTRHLELVKSLGADHVIDYTRENFTKNGRHYDVILAANGYHPILDYKRSLTPRGIYVMSGGTGGQMAQAMLLGPLLSRKNGKKLGNFLSTPNKKDLLFLRDLMEAGKLKAVIDRRYPLSQVADAIRYLEKGHARGKVVINVIE